jgi:hypothetical protein
MAKYAITSSTELIDNYLQADIMRPERRLQAVEGPAGGTLLFSVGTEDAGSPLNVTVESMGKRHGWATSALTGPTAGVVMAGECKNFATGRSPDGRLHLVTVLSHAGRDQLFVCRNATTQDAAWCKSPDWHPLPYDDQQHVRDHIVVADLFVTEATGKTVLVVDILRDPSEQAPKLYRYYVDADAASGSIWKPHDLAADIEAGHYASAMGRIGGQERFVVDGLYTAGETDGAPLLIYTPLYNVMDPGIAPSPVQLTPPGGVTADALTTVRRDDGTTDLYVAAGASLYLFPADAQRPAADGQPAKGEQILSHALLERVIDLFAYASGPDEITVWGRNANDTVFVTRRSEGAWSTPLPILENAEQVSPFFNGTQSAETFFAHTGQNALVKATKSPKSAMWTRQDIHLAPPDSATAALKFSSYTTTFQLSGDSHGEPTGVVKVKLSSPTLTPVYINHLYYVVAPEPIEIETDKLGRLTVIEAVRSLTGAQLVLDIEGDASHSVNPMQGPLGKATGLDSADKLRGATVRDVHGNAHPLVPPGAGDDVLNAIATANQQLQAAHKRLQPASKEAQISRALVAEPVGLVESTPPPESVLVDVGDFFMMVAHCIENNLKADFKVLKDLANDIWTVVVKIGDALFTAILDSLEAIAAAATWLYDKARILVQDLIDYLKLLFDIGALSRTKYVLKSSAKMMIALQMNSILEAKDQLDQLIVSAKKAVDLWAGVVDWKNLDNSTTNAGSAMGSTGENGLHHGTQGSFLAHHMHANLNRVVGADGGAGEATNLVEQLLTLIVNEKDAFGTAFEGISNIFKRLPEQSLVQVLSELAAVVADLSLESTKNLLDTFLNAILGIIVEVMKFLDTPIYIPVVSDILKEFGIPEFSLLDLFCWVGAFAANAVYIAAVGSEPFPLPASTNTSPMAMDAACRVGDAVDAETTTDPWESLREMENLLARLASIPNKLDLMSNIVKSAKLNFDAFLAQFSLQIYVTGTAASSLLTMICGVVTAFEAASRPGGELSKPVGALNVASAATSFAGEYAGNFSTIQNKVVKCIGLALSGGVLLAKLGFIIQTDDTQKPPNFSRDVGKMTIDTWRGVIAMVDGVVSIFLIGIRGYRLYELANMEESWQRSLGIIYETGNICDYLNRIAYAVAVNTSPPIQDAAAGAVWVTGTANGLMFGTEAVVRLVYRKE